MRKHQRLAGRRRRGVVAVCAIAFVAALAVMPPPTAQAAAPVATSDDQAADSDSLPELSVGDEHDKASNEPARRAERHEDDFAPTVIDRHLPRPTARIQRAPRFARALWRVPDEKLKPRGAIGGEELALEGFEYRYSTGGDGAWSDWQIRERSHSEWISDLSSESEIAFQLRSVWRSQTGELSVSPRATLEAGARSASGGERAECTSQPGRQPGVAYVTGGERTYVPLTTNLCLGSLLVEQTDLDLKVPGPDLQIKRTYNSYLSYAGGMLGFGWTSSLERSVIALPNGDVLYEDGQGASFVFEKSGSTYTRPAGLYLELRKLPDGRFTLTDKENVVETYSRTGQLTSIVDSDGNTTTLTWFGDRLAQLTDSAGRQTTLTYDGWGLLWKITDPAGQYVEFSHNQGDLSSVSYPGDSDNPRRTTLFAYDAEHRLARTGTPELAVRGDTVSGTDCGDKPGEATILYDAQGRLKSITNERHIIDDANQVELCGRPIGTSTTYLYEFGEQTCPDPVCVTDPREHLESYILDGQGRPQQVIDAEGRPTYLSYDSDSNLTEAIEFRASRQLKTELSYDSRGNLTSLKEPDHERATLFRYDSRNNLVWKQTPRARLTSAGLGVGKTRAADGQTAAKGAGFLPKEAACFSPDAEHLASFSYTYTSSDRLQTLTTSGCATWRFEYDPRGNRTATVDPNGNRTAFTYNALGGLTSITHPGSASPAYTYEDDICEELAGSKGKVDGARANYVFTLYAWDGSLERRFTHDPPHFGPLGCVPDFLGPYDDAIFGIFDDDVVYDTNGNPAVDCASAAYGIEWPYFYPWWSPSTAQVAREPNGSPRSSSSRTDRSIWWFCPLEAQGGGYPDGSPFDDEHGTGPDLLSETTGNQVDEETWSRLTDASGQTQYGEAYRTTYYAADGAIKDVKANADLVMIQHHTHDAQDNDVRVDRDLERVTQTATFDDANRETSRKIERLGATSPWLDERYVYDEDDNVTAVTSDAERTSLAYDEDGQLIGKTIGGATTTWNYDAAGDRLREEGPGGEARVYSYGDDGTLLEVICDEDWVEPCPHSTRYEHDGAGRLIAESNDAGESRSFWWDALGRLTRVDGPGERSLIFSYWGVSNGLRAKQVVRDPLDQGETPQVAIEYHYDANGRLAAEVDRTDFWSPSIRAVYNYDGQGNLVSTSQPEGGQFKTYWYDFDALGNVVGLNDESELKNSYRYDAWGNLTSSTGSVYNPFRYKGTFWDEDLQMYYIGDRWYDPRIGRFISPPVMPDPNEDAESVYDVSNPYVFANNNPLKYKNPSGWPPTTQVRRLGLDYFRSPSRFRKERVPQYWELKRRIELGSPSRAEGLR